MTERSRVWDGTTIGDATDAPYDAATEFSAILMSVAGAAGIATYLSGVFRGELNQLAPSGSATPVSIATGRSLTWGTWYENDAVTQIAIPTPSVATRIDRIVLRKSWASQTVRLTRIAGTEGAGAPALTNSAGTTWDQPIAQVSITTGGVITITDERSFIGSSPLSGISAFATGDLLYAANATTLARLAVGGANTVLVGGGAIPAWSANPTLTSLTLAGGNLTLSSGVVSITSATGNTGLTITNTDAGANGVAFVAYHNSASPAANDVIFELSVQGKDSGGNVTNYGSIRHIIDDPTNGSEDSKWSFWASVAGALTNIVNLSATGLNIVTGNIIMSTAASGITPGATRFSVNNNAESAFNLYIADAGLLCIRDTSNVFMTTGLTINQAGNDDEILAFKSDDVSHGITSLLETDSYATFKKIVSTDGGLWMTGASDTNIGILIQGLCSTAPDTTRSTAATGGILLQTSVKTGTSAGGAGVNANLVVFRNHGTAVALIDAEGDLHLDATSNINAWDNYNDAEMGRALRASVLPSYHPIRERFGHLIEKYREPLVATGLITYNDDGHHFVNITRLTMFNTDAIWQISERMSAVINAIREASNLDELKAHPALALI